MKTNFKYYDESGNLIDANLVISFEFNNKKYVVYDLDKENSDELDILHVREYEEVDNVPHLYKVDDKEMEQIKVVLETLFKEIK